MEKSPSASATWLPGLFRFWAVFTLITFGVMLMHRSDDAVLFERYSLLVIIQIGVLFFAAFALWGCANYLKHRPELLTRIGVYLHHWRIKPGFAPIIIILMSSVLAFLWVFFLGNHLPTYGFLRMFLGLSVCVGALALIYGGTSPQTVSWKFLPYFLIALLGLLIFITLPYYPALTKTDEAFVFSMARNALETGQYRPMIYRQAYPEYYYGGIWIWMMAGWLKIANISLVAGRLYVLLLSGVSLGFLYGGITRLYDRVTAWFVVLFGVYAFATLNHIRFDIHTAFWLSVGIFFYSLTQTSKRWWPHLATGFALGMCIDSNPIGYCFGLGLFVVYVWEYIQLLRQKRLKLYRPFFWMALGGVIALVLYLRLHSGSAFAKDQTTDDMISYYTTIIRNNFISGGYRLQLDQYLNAFLTSQPILFGFMVLGIVTAFKERKHSDYVFLIMYFTWMTVVVFAYFYFPAFYLMLALPLFLVLAARGAAHALPRLIGTVMTESSALMRTTSILLTVWLFAGLVVNVMNLPSQSLEDVVEVGRRMSDIVPQDATIVAAEAYYFGMLEHHNFVGGAMESALGSYFGTPPEKVWLDVQPDAVVFSEGWPTEPGRSAALLSYMEEENFGLQACYETASFGHIELWARNIPTNSSSDLSCTVVCNPRTGC